MHERGKWIEELSQAIAARRWGACSVLLYRALYGLSPSILLPLASERAARTLPGIEKRWPGVQWPREIIENTERWIQHSGRAVPPSPEADSVGEASFVFSLDALLLAWSHPGNRSVLVSSCACAIREAVNARVQISAEEDGYGQDAIEECEGCGASAKSTPAPDPDSPIEIARSREWQSVLDTLLSRNLQDYPDPESMEQLEADLAVWEEHAELLIVPDAPAVA